MLPLPPDFDNMTLTTNPGPLNCTPVALNVSVQDHYVKYGSHTDIYYGRVLAEAPEAFVSYTASPHVAIKMVRLNHHDDKIRQEILTAIAIAVAKSSTLSHPFLCPIWTLTSRNGCMPAVAMPWFSNGNVLEFTQRNPSADKLEITKQLADVVNYIHGKGEVHGNIFPANVMICDDGRPCLDVGLNACLVKVVWGDRKPVPPSWMFKSPEELSFDGEHASFMTTQAMDVCALGATIYTIFTSEPPLPVQAAGSGVKEIMTRGHCLNKPACITVSLWNILQRCWAYFPEDRPSMATVVAGLGGL